MTDASKPMNVRDLNLALARALGVKDTSRVTRIELVIDHTDIPRMKVYRHLMPDTSSGEIVQTMVELTLTTAPLPPA